MDWGLLNIIALATIEIGGDFLFKFYITTNLTKYLYGGIAAYVGVVYFLIQSLRYGNVLYVNALWDGMSSIVESIAAYVILGDRLSGTQQYVGLLLTLSGMVLMKL
jgi:multidrug transporter EmrE-like cation transporter